MRRNSTLCSKSFNLLEPLALLAGASATAFSHSATEESLKRSLYTSAMSCGSIEQYAGRFVLYLHAILSSLYNEQALPALACSLPLDLHIEAKKSRIRKYRETLLFGSLVISSDKVSFPLDRSRRCDTIQPVVCILCLVCVLSL